MSPVCYFTCNFNVFDLDSFRVILLNCLLKQMTCATAWQIYVLCWSHYCSSLHVLLVLFTSGSLWIYKSSNVVNGFAFPPFTRKCLITSCMNAQILGAFTAYIVMSHSRLDIHVFSLTEMSSIQIGNKCWKYTTNWHTSLHMSLIQHP